ncbi:E3 ubiquitin-protein ligase RNF170, partial [Dermacentor silvarum]|uniref:E3 ubiquitin-protein ligase RNF170 n=1 Tax=Dermacentor silvarum TaxID=543639 RepID=UPI002100B19E
LPLPLPTFSNRLCQFVLCENSYLSLTQWLDHLRDLPTLLRHAGSEFFSVGGIMYMFRLRIVLCFVAAIMYLISPLDMIPEAIFGILGLLDDLFVVLLLAIYVTVIYRRFLAARWQEDAN